MSRFLRFFRIFVVAIICGFGVFTGAFSAQAGVTLDDQGAISAGAPHNIGSLSPNTQLLTDFPYKPGYGFAGYYTQTNCGGNRILTHEGKWSGTQYNGTIYACWVQLVPGGMSQPSQNTKLFVLDKNAGDTVGNMWPNLNPPIEFDTTDYNFGGTGRSIRFENRGDWVYLRCYTYRNGICEDLQWRMPRNAAGDLAIWSSTKLFWTIQGVQKLPTRSGYAFGGIYSTSGTTGGTQYCNANGNTTDINSLWNSSLPAFNTIYSRWNAMTVNLDSDGGTVSPRQIYFDGSNWYAYVDATSPISSVSVTPPESYGFGGYWTDENGTGVKVIDENGHLLTGTDVANAIYNEIILHPHWVASSTWATLSINNQDGLRSVWKLYYPLSGCSIPGYHTSQDCLNTNVVASLADWSGHWPVEKDGWSYGGHYSLAGGAGTQYIESDGGFTNSLLDGITNPTTVYAKWSFSVSLPSGQTTGPNTGCPSGTYCCVFGTECNAPSPTISAPSGKQFAGWACSLVGATGSCARTKYAAGESLLGATNNVYGATGITLTATWESTGATVVYKRVTLNPNGGTGGTQYIYERYLNEVTQGFFTCTGASCDRTGANCSCTNPTAVSGSIFNSGISQPTKDGNRFNGYYSGNSEKINSDGIIQSSLYGNTPVVLSANWLDTQTVYLNPGGLGSFVNCSTETVQVVPGEPPLEPRLSCVPTANAGWNFIGYYDGDNDNATQYYDANGYAVYPDNVWPISNAPRELIARYSPVAYVVNYYCKKGNGPNVLARTDNVRNGDQYTVWNGAGVDACANTTASSSQAGSKLVGWGYGDTGNSNSLDYSVGQTVTSFEITHNISFSMVQKPIYYVTLNHCNDSSCSAYPVSNSPNPSVVYFSNGNWYNDALATTPRTIMNPKPERLGYTFGGYNTESNGSGNTVVNSSGAFVTGDNIHANPSTIYAQWNITLYSFPLERGEGVTGGTQKLFYRMDRGWCDSEGCTNTISSISKPNAPNGKIFGGYYTGQNGTGTLVIDGQETILYTGTGQNSDAMNLISGLSDMTFYAKWDDMPSAPTNPNEYFAVTTTDLSAGDTFKFEMSAAGSFYVDWGDRTVVPIVRDNTNLTVYSHRYTTSGSKTIKIWAPQNGGATMYNSSCYPTISFGGNGATPEFVAGIYGSLGAVFPTINGGVNDADIPSFNQTFSGCSNLVANVGSLGNLFSGVTGTKAIMFLGLFDGCSRVTGAIPADFFSGISGPVKEGCVMGMFQSTFRDTGVTSIPAGLFSGLSGIGYLLFDETFKGTGITSIPDGLFSTITTTNSTGSTYRTFGETFKNTALEALPQNLFGTIVINEDQQATFVSMFQGNGDLSGYVPKTLFASITDNTSGPGTNSIMSTIFSNTPNLATSCDSYNLTKYTTGFENYWNGKVSCAPAAVFSCGIGTGTAPNSIFVTPVNTGSVSFTFPSGANCTAPAHYTKNNTWTCDGNVCNNGSITWGSNGQTPFNGTWNGQQSVTFYMTYTPDVYTIVLNQNHSNNDNTTVSGSPIKERYGDAWLDSNGVVLDPQKAHVPSSWTSNNTTYNFKGYFTSRSGGTRMTTNDGTFVNDAATHTVGSDGTWYAQWDDSNNVTFKCEENGSAINGYSFSDVQSGDSINVPATSVCTKTGYTFTQWKIVENDVLIDETNNGGTYTWNYNFGSDVVPNWQLVETTITLNSNFGESGTYNELASTNGTTAIYTRYSSGAYRDANRTESELMTTSQNPLASVPTKSVNFTLSFVGGTLDNGSASPHMNSVTTIENLDLDGFYDATTGGNKVIEPQLFNNNLEYYITTYGSGGNGASGYTENKTWYARWSPRSLSGKVVPLKPGNVFAGWYTAETGGDQITGPDGNLNGNTIDSNTTWYAQWTECSHNFGANPHATKTSMTAVEGMCRYQITCANGYSQYGGTNTTEEFNVTISPDSTDTLPGCFGRQYVIGYENLDGHNATMPNGAPEIYTHGGTDVIINADNATPISPTDVFVKWCTGYDNGIYTGCADTHTINAATEIGNKTFYAKWTDTCRLGYTKYNYYTQSAEFDGPVDHSAGTCAPIRYRVKCHKNCPGGDENCKACLEDFAWDNHSVGSVRFGGVYNSYYINGTTGDDFVHGYEPVYAGSCTGDGCLYAFTQSPDANYMVAPVWYATDALRVAYLSNNYKTFMNALAANNNTSPIGIEHYTFGGLWTTANNDGDVYIPANGNVAWTRTMNPNNTQAAQAFSRFFVNQLGGGNGTNNNYEVNVYAHWIPDEYTVTLNKNGGSWKQTSVKNIYEKWANGWSKNGTDYYTASTFNSDYALSSSELPTAPTGYNFGGYYTGQQTAPGGTCPGTRIINSNGKLNTSAAASTYGNVSNAKYFGANGSTLYACWTAKQQTITLDRNLGGAHGTSSDITIYTKYMTGVYTNSARTSAYKMSASANPASPLPERYWTITYMPNYPSGSGCSGSMDPVNVQSVFNGYFGSSSGGDKYINGVGDDPTYAPGYITSIGDFTAQGYTDNTKMWYAQWTNGSHDLVLPACDGYVFKGWYSDQGLNNYVGDWNRTLEPDPSSDMQLYAKWAQCNWTAGANSTAAIQPMDNQHYPNRCKYRVTCTAGYDHDGDSQFDYYGDAGVESGTLPGCTANGYTITYYDNPAYEATDPLHTQGYTYNPNGSVTLWTPDSDILAAHHASSVQWCANSDGTNCETDNQIGPGAQGNKTFYAKWTCATGYRTYTYETNTREYGNDNSVLWAAGTCAPSRYRIMCDKNCPAGETCNACLENFNFLTSNTTNKYSFGSIYNGEAVNLSSCVDTWGGDWLPVPVYEKSNPSNAELFTKDQGSTHYAILNCWAQSDLALSTAYVSGNYKTFMDALANKSYNSAINFGATHYNFDGLWTAASGGNKYIGADGLSPTGGGAFDTQEMSTFFTSDTNVYAHWDPKEYDITLCPENGTACTPGSMSGQVNLKQKWDTGWKIAPSHDNYETAEVFNNNNPLSSRLPTYDGYNFMGYYTEQQSGNNCQGIKIINADGTLNTTVSGISGAKYFENGDGSTLYACWHGVTYNISFDLNNGTSRAPISAQYNGAVTHIDNPTPVNNDGVHHQHAFKGWSITRMQGNTNHEYGSTDSLGSYTTGASLELNNTDIQYFKNLRMNSDQSVLFTAKWECEPGYGLTTPDCTDAGTYRITVVADTGRGMDVVHGTGWTGSNTSTMYKDFDIGDTITFVQPTDEPGGNVTATPKVSYGGATYSKQDESMPGQMTTNDNQTYTFTVGAGNATIKVKPKTLAGPNPNLTGGATKVYNHQNVTLAGGYSAVYPTDTGIKLSYELRESDTSAGQTYEVVSSGNNLNPVGWSLAESIAKNKFKATKYYKLYLSASDGHIGGGSDTSSVSVTLKNAPVTFNANGGTLTSGSVSPLYVAYNDENLYDAEFSSNSATVPSATLSNYTFAGWYTTSNGGTRVYDANGNLSSNVSGYVNGGKWVVTDPTNGVVLYAHWTPKIYTVTLDKNGGTNGSVTKIYEKYNTGWSTSNSGTFGTLTLSGNQLPTRTGHTFVGFYDAGTGGNPKGTYSNGVWTAPTSSTTVTGATTWYAHWTANTYQIQYNLNNGQTRDNTSVSYNQTTGPIANPTKVNNGTYHQESFAGWNVTNMQSGITHYYGTTTSVSAHGTGTSWSYTDIGPSIKYFKNLRADTGTVLFEAVWNCVYPYQGAACDTTGGVTVTVNAGDGIASVNGGTGWTGNGTGTITRTVAVGTQIDLSNFATAKAGYTGRAYVKTSGEGTLSDGTFTVGAGDAVININATGIETPSVTLSPATTNQIYNYQPVTLTATAKRSDGSQYAQGITFAYEFAEASSTSGPWNYVTSANNGTSNTKNIDKDEFLGSKFYKARVTARGEGTLSSSSAAESDVASVELNQKQLTFDTNGGTLSDTSGRYIRYNSDKLYNSATENTVKTVPGATKTGYSFDGWFTQAEGGDKIYEVDGANLTLTGNNVDGWIGDGVWKSTIARKVYAHWTPKKLKITLNRNGATTGTPEFYEQYGEGYALTSSATDWVLTQITVPTKTGYDFAGYYDTEDFSGTMVIGTNGKLPMTDGVVNPAYFTQDTILYAKWTKKSYTVTYDCNGNGGGNTQAAEYDTNFTVRTLAQANCNTSVPGATFGGWAVTPAGGTRQPGDVFTWKYTANQTFTAIWTNNTYTLTYSCGTGTGTPPASWTGNYHAPITVSGVGNCAKVGHSFTGWAVTPAGGTQQPGEIAGGWPYTANQTFTAQWTADTYDVRYNLGGGTTTLQVGYVPVEYITFTGTQVIDTGLKIKKGYEIQTKFYPTDTGKYVYGALSSGNSKTVSGYVSTAGGNWRWGNKAISKTMSLNSTYTIVQNASALTVNGVPAAYETQDNFETVVTLSIGKAHNASEGTPYDASGFKGRMYWFTIRDDNGNVVYHGVPVKNTANNQYGLCNIIDGTCLTASGINGATATLPATYNHGTATTVSGAAERANSVFNSWCSSPSSNCNSAQTIPATATGDKTFYAKWTCDAGYSYSSGGACVANTITLDWNENGGVGLANGSCTYNGDLTLAGAPTYADHVFNGWKLANNTYGGASTTINGGCVQAYTGVTSGTSTAITAQWCNACNPTNATCELEASVPGTCSYATECNTGYHLSPDSQLNVYNTVCIPYTITYQSDGHGDGATDDILYNSTFTTNDAKNSSQFNWANHIVTAWTTVSGGNFPDVGGSYTYNVQSDTVLKANWGECHCTPESHVSSCSTTSSDNACEVDVIDCATGYTGSSWSCDGINCTATCSDSHSHRIVLRKVPGSGGTALLNAIDNGATSGAGVYLNNVMMETNSNPVDLPTLTRTLTYNASNGTLIGSATVTANATFNGYYDSSNGTNQYIDNDGYITLDGIAAGKASTTNQIWFAQWTEGSVTLPVAYRAGYTLAGWWTTPDGDDSGINRGNAGASYIPSVNETLYAHWTQCAAGTYCPGSETVNNQTVYNQIHNCPTKYSNSAAGSTMISDCYLVLTPGKYVSTAGNGMVNCTRNYYCDDNTTKVYYSNPGDGRRTTGIRKSCATNAGSFKLTNGTGKTSINACYKNVVLDKRGGTEQSGSTSIPDTTPCNYNIQCTLPDASVLELTGHTFHGGWTDQPDTDCNSTTRVFVVPNDTNTYYACRTPNTYAVTLKDGLDTNAAAFATVNAVYGAAMPSVDSNNNPLTVPTKTASHTIYTFEGYYSTPNGSTTATQYYDEGLNSVHVWSTEGNGTLYARWSVACDPGYYLPANATSCTTLCPAGRYCAGNTTFMSFDVPKSSSQGLSGYIAAGYYSTGGGTSATPTAAGNGCLTGNSCGLVAGGRYSTGGGTSATPTGVDNGCLSGNNRSCGLLPANYYSNGGGTNNAGACVTGQTCGACPTKYRSNSDTGKTVITQCTAACGAGTQVATAETTTNNGCKTPLGNTWWSNAHEVAYGSASPTVTGVNENGVHMCANYYETPNTEVADDHNEQRDCARGVPLYKNGGATVDGAVWPDNVTDNGGTVEASATCAEGVVCDFGNPANLLEQTGYTFQANWGTNASCSSTVGTSVTTPTATRYYACKTQNNYTLTYACGTGATGDAPNQQTNIHYGDTVSVSGAGGCAKTGHTFAGWAVSGTSDVITATTWPHSITWNYDGTKTFTAQWTADTYDISYVWNGGTAGSILPDGYTQLEYIDTVSTTGPYINTGITYDSTKEIIVKLVAQSNGSLSSSNMVALGFGGSAGQWFGVSSGEKWTIGTGGVSNVVAGNKTADIQIRWSGGTEYLNIGGISVGNRTVTNPSATLQFFGRNNSGSFTGKMYSAQVIVDGVLVHNYVPAQNSDGVVGLYDTVTGVFLTNRGNGSFTPGNPVTAAYPNQYTYGVGATVTGGAVRANSVFQGWCRTASLTNCAAPHEITTTDLGIITLHAKWGCVAGYHLNTNTGVCDANEFTLVYSKNGHGTQDKPDDQTCTYGQQINLAAALSETGWNFNGWTIAGENYVGGAPIICNEQYLGVTGGTVNVDVNVTADWSARCNKIILATNSNDATWPSGAITALYAKTRESGSTTDGKWYKDNGCTIEYNTAADYQKVIPMRSGWAFRGFYAVQSDAADVSATQTNGVEQHIDHTGAPTSTGQTFINGLNANTVLYAGWARNCTNPVAHGTCSRTIGQNTTYTTTCATGYHYDPTASESTYNPICVPNTITIILNKNGGTGTCGGQSGTTSGTLTCNYDGTCNTPVWGNTCALSKTGKIFAGWSTTADGTGAQSCGTTGTQSCGTATVAGDVQNMNDGTTSTTLYAVWKDVVCNVTNGTAIETVIGGVQASGNTPGCVVRCESGYESSGGVIGQQHEYVVNTGRCNVGTYDIRYHYDAEHGGALASLLPDGYTQLEYIESTGTQYIDTGINGLNTGNWEIYAKWMVTDTPTANYPYIVGAYSAETVNAYRVILKLKETEAYYVSGNSKAGGGSVLISNKPANTIHTATINNGYVVFDGVSYNTPTQGTTIPASVSIKLFSSNGTSVIKGRIYASYAKKDGVYKYNYIPAKRNSDDAIGMYDLADPNPETAFHGNAGTGTFGAGNPVTEMHPNQYTYGTGATVYGGATRANSVFEGWCRNLALTDGCTMVPHVIGTTEYGLKNLYAKWSCVNGYHLDGNNQCVGNTITINYNKGEHGVGAAPQPTTCTFGGNATLRPGVSDPAWVFTGWRILNDEYSGGANITCDYNTLGVYGNTSDDNTVTATAQWAADTFVVSYSCGNTTWTQNTPPADDVATTGIRYYARQNTCVNPGYRFAGWRPEGETTNWVDGTPWDYTEDKTFVAQWVFEPSFTVTITVPANTSFEFKTYAKGQFVVDWDDASGLDVRKPTVTSTAETWSYSYANAGTYDIKIGGLATEYSSSLFKPAIIFFTGTAGTGSTGSTSYENINSTGTEQYIDEISGSLGRIFPTLGTGGTKQPHFTRTFMNATNMEINVATLGNLFSGISGAPVAGMFMQTFQNCSNLEGRIPATLFPINGAPVSSVFRSTFKDCSKLTYIPEDLFVGLGGTPASYMFYRTFEGCTGLTEIPAGLFRNISGVPASYMFARTFYGCSNVVGNLSSNLFGSINGAPAGYMFYQTFTNCTELVGTGGEFAIPDGMFGVLSGDAASNMFYGTFDGCQNLTGKIGRMFFDNLTGDPAAGMFREMFKGCKKISGGLRAGMFGNMTGAPADNMFQSTFNGCSGLTDSIPSGLFGNISGEPATGMFRETFNGCTSLTSSIPSGLFGNISGAPADSMFYSTFANSGVSGAIPANLFKGNGSGLSGDPAANMFRATFYNCSGLTGTIPGDLFGAQNLTGTAKSYMFYYTFRGCSGLSGYVPEGLFGTITVPSSVPSGMMSYVFADSGLLTECPCGTTDVSAESPFYTYWRSTSASANPKKVSCRVEQTPGAFYWYNGICTTKCPLDTMDELHVGNLSPYPVLAEEVSTRNVAVKYNDTTCYVPLAAGAGANKVNVKYGSSSFHLERAADTPPAWFGQR